MLRHLIGSAVIWISKKPYLLFKGNRGHMEPSVLGHSSASPLMLKCHYHQMVIIMVHFLALLPDPACTRYDSVRAGSGLFEATSWKRCTCFFLSAHPIPHHNVVVDHGFVYVHDRLPSYSGELQSECNIIYMAFSQESLIFGPAIPLIRCSKRKQEIRSRSDAHRLGYLHRLSTKSPFLRKWNLEVSFMFSRDCTALTAGYHFQHLLLRVLLYSISPLPCQPSLCQQSEW